MGSTCPAIAQTTHTVRLKKITKCKESLDLRIIIDNSDMNFD